VERGRPVVIPEFVVEVIERVALEARGDRRVDKRSGVSQRLPITALENAVSNAERRAVLYGEATVVPRISDVYAALPSLTGKFELEYEGELVGAERVARDLIREAVGEVFSNALGTVNFRAIISFFEGGSTLRLSDEGPAEDVLLQLRGVPELLAHTGRLGVKPGDAAPLVVAAGEFILEGLWAQKKIGRSDDKGFVAVERPRDSELDMEQLERIRNLKKQVN
jgi:magnesium chelatase subunit I